MSEKKFLVTEDGSHTIFLPDLNETYHSKHGAIQESEYVFIESGLDFLVSEGLNQIRVFEVGLGTGLNALLSWIYAEQRHISIDYQSIEAFPLNEEEIQKLNYAEQIKGNSAKEKFTKIHNANWGQWEEVSDAFHIRKIEGIIQDFIIEDEIDICFFDAFAPSKQPEMWDIAILQKIANALRKDGVFVTYCAKGQLKRDLKSLGFEVTALPGPPGKFEMVRAIKK